MSKVAALTVTSDKSVEVSQVLKPVLRSATDVLVKVLHVAQNPTDWKHVAFGFSILGSTVGCDFADVKTFKKGDVVAGCVHGGLPPSENYRGAFCDYVVQDSAILFKVPSSITPAQASTLPLASITAALALHYQSLSLTKSSGDILIWSGMTSVGQYAIQLATIAGLRVITTASPHNHEFLKSLGAKVLYDYKSPTVLEDIKKETGGKLMYALDCMSENGSVGKVASCLSTAGGAQIATLLPGNDAEVPKTVTQRSVMMYTIFNRSMHVFDHAAKPEDFKFASEFYASLEKVLIPGGFVPNKVKLLEGGLSGVKAGFEMMKTNAPGTGGVKLIYTL